MPKVALSRYVMPRLVKHSRFAAFLVFTLMAAASAAWADTENNINQNQSPIAAAAGTSDSLDTPPTVDMPDASAGPSPPPPALMDLQNQANGSSDDSKPEQQLGLH